MFKNLNEILCFHFILPKPLKYIPYIRNSSYHLVTTFLVELHAKRKGNGKNELDLPYRVGMSNMLSLNFDQAIKMSKSMFIMKPSSTHMFLSNTNYLQLKISQFT